MIALKQDRITRSIYDWENILSFLEENDIDSKYFLSEQQIEKFAYLKGNKRILRTKPDGKPYYYSEGAMPFPNNLNVPARTMLTSEGGGSRTTHVIEGFKTKKLDH